MRIVVLGGGFGGLTAVRQLGKLFKKIPPAQRPEIVLIDKNPYHTYTPTLYEIAATAPETATYPELKSIVTFPLADILRRYDATFLRETVTDIDAEAHMLLFATHERYAWDYLLIATGSEPNFFGIPGAETFGHPMKSFDQAIRIRDAIYDVLDRHQEAPTIAIAGGGTTGVELAGEIAAWLRSREFIRIMPLARAAKVVIVESDKLLKQFSSVTRRTAERRLRRLGVGIVIGERIVRVNKNELILASEQKVPFSVLAWTGGVTAPLILEKIRMKQAGGRLETTSEMRCIQPDGAPSPSVFSIGDSAFRREKTTGMPAPALAQAAIDQGRVAAINIARDCGVNVQSIIYRHPFYYPAIIPIGGKFAIVTVGPVAINGFTGWILKGLVELRYLLALTPPLPALSIWLKGLWIFIQNDRLG